MSAATDQFDAFVDDVYRALHEHFGDSGAALVLGLQWRDIDPGVTCMVASNMDPEGVRAALTDMLDGLAHAPTTPSTPPGDVVEMG